MARNSLHWLIVRMDYSHRIVTLFLHPRMISHAHIWQLTARANADTQIESAEYGCGECLHTTSDSLLSRSLFEISSTEHLDWLMTHAGFL